jgi:hypothetical protein
MWMGFFSPFSNGIWYAMILSVLISSTFITLSTKINKFGTNIVSVIFGWVQNGLIMCSLYLGNKPPVTTGISTHWKLDRLDGSMI